MPQGKPRQNMVYVSAERSRLWWMAVSPRIFMLGLSHLQNFLRP
jgi:hypothetical protein